MRQDLAVAEEVAREGIEFSRRNLPGLTAAEREMYTVLCTNALVQVYTKMAKYTEALPLAR